jgi:hypothetical protein
MTVSTEGWEVEGEEDGPYKGFENLKSHNPCYFL